MKRLVVLIVWIIGMALSTSAQVRCCTTVSGGAFTGGILALSSETASNRTRPAATSLGFDGSTRECLQNGSTYGNMWVCKLTIASGSDCGDACVQQSGYSNTPACGPKSGNTIQCLVGLQDHGFVTIFSIDTSGHTVTKRGSVATSGTCSGSRGTLWSWSLVDANKLIAFCSADQAIAYECDVTSLPATCSTWASVHSAGAAAAHGLGTSGLRVGEVHCAHDSDKCAFPLTNQADQIDRGCLYYQKSTDTWKWKPHPNGSGNNGTIHCGFSGDGNWMIALMENPTGPLNMFAWNWTTAALQSSFPLLDDCGSPGHSDDWYLGLVGNDNFHATAGATRIWYADRAGINSTLPDSVCNGGHTLPQGTVNAQYTTWSPAMSFTQISARHQTASASSLWMSYTGSVDNGTDNNPSQPRDRELWLAPMDNTLRSIVLTPTFATINTGGGTDNYNRAPKPNVNGDGTAIFWISNMDGSTNLEAWVVLDVDLAAARLLAWSGAPEPQPHSIFDSLVSWMGLTRGHNRH